MLRHIDIYEILIEKVVGKLVCCLCISHAKQCSCSHSLSSVPWATCSNNPLDLQLVWTTQRSRNSRWCEELSHELLIVYWHACLNILNYKCLCHDHMLVLSGLHSFNYLSSHANASLQDVELTHPLSSLLNWGQNFLQESRWILRYKYAPTLFDVQDIFSEFALHSGRWLMRQDSLSLCILKADAPKGKERARSFPLSGWSLSYESCIFYKADVMRCPLCVFHN